MKNIEERTFFEGCKRFFEPMKVNKIEYSKEIFKSLLVAINGVIHVLFLEKIVESLEKSNTELFHCILFIYIAYIIIFELLHFFIRKWGWMNTLPFTIAYLYKTYLNSYIRMDNNKIELIGTGKLIGVINEGSGKWAELLSDTIDQGAVIIVTILFTLYMVGKVDYMYGVVFIILIILFFLLIVWINKKLGTFRSRRYEYRNTRLKQFVKIIMNKMEILQMGKIEKEIDGIYETSRNISQVSRDMATYRAIMKRTAPLVITILILFVFWYMGGAVLSGTISLGVLVGLTGTLIIMQSSISSSIGFYVTFSKQFISIEKMWDFIDSTPQIQGYDKGKTFKHSSGDICLENMSYGYEETKKVFDDFSLKISGGKVIAFVGPSGGGKSTLVKLIAGYIRQDSGKILIDKQNLRKTSLKSYYKNIGYLTQEPSVFDGTIEENLLYSVKKKPSKKELKKVIEQAHCEFIYDLSNGLDTEIGERGVRLSGGQKQRLAIAKIFLKNPQIIILDEPTSALDSLSEKKITQAMHNLFIGRTVLVIAHRLQTVKHADDIIVIEAGKVLERGTHNELVKKKGFYKQMLDLQSGF